MRTHPPVGSLLRLLPGRRAALALAAAAFLAPPAGAEVLSLIITVDGHQAVPSVETKGMGAGTATFDTDTNEFAWNVSFEGLSSEETAAHFHGSAPQCETASPVIGLPLGSPKIGSQTLTDKQAAALLDGLWYLNIHTVNHPAGEIRGQVMPDGIDNPVETVIPRGNVHIQLVPVATELTAPNWGAPAPGDDSRLFVTDQSGILWAINLVTLEKIVFLDVTLLIVDLGIFGEGSFDERGLLGIAFHPDYQKNGLLYTYTSEPVVKSADFSTMPEGVLANHQSVIREWQVPDPADPDSVVDPDTTRVLMLIDQPQFNHDAGNLAFGPDGMLYISLGDGGGADDKDGQVSLGEAMVGHGCIGNGQDAEGQNILGSLVRIDPLGNNSANGQYGIPGDNPFVGGDPRLDEIFAYGFRNPFRFSFDSGTGDLYLADVGQNHLEEINIVTAGQNYGWNFKEGTFNFVANGDLTGYATDRPLAVPAGLIDPIAEYDHDEGLAIIGGFVYRGTKIAPLAGRYVFGEFARTFAADGRLFFLGDSLEGGDTIVEFELVGQEVLGIALFGFGQDAHGELYVFGNPTGVPFGTQGVVLKMTTGLGDVNADGVVSFADLLVVLGDWGKCDRCPADINEDGVVSFEDLLIVLSNWS